MAIRINLPGANLQFNQRLKLLSLRLFLFIYLFIYSVVYLREKGRHMGSFYGSLGVVNPLSR